ncbi:MULTISPECIES: 4Fe-4S dicluster domain-containing protein [Leptotrichia]|uniref:4Fe-4S dicluster domain-containing protein n=1 Tax=Leptotrichia TaxID=32067 RepID=UPI0015BEDBD4|nr:MULTISPECIES: 4Fe-4S dicluster domain-containing protein [Leptotrichia]NWO20082.1 anaerobic sulfite reductase subunit AsrA [Leptotrichia sp. oral taxon 223]
MKISLNRENFNLALEKLKKEYKIYAPIEIPFRGTFSDTSVIRYSEIEKIDEICFDKKSHFSAKEIMLPITQTMFYFTEEGCKMPKEQEQKYLIFLRSCDLHGVKRVDDIYLNNKFLDIYYKRVRDKVKFVVFGCPNSFENCFCVDMGTNKTDEYNIGIKVTEEEIFADIKDDELKVYFKELIAEKNNGNNDENKINEMYLDVKDEKMKKYLEEIIAENNSNKISENVEFEMEFVEDNEIHVDIPDNIELEDIINLDLWREYDSRCIACGKCNFVCPTCTCTTTQDVFYSENENNGERRRVWASCHVNGFTDMAGGHSFRQRHGDRMRFKVMHKISDFKKRFGYQMCTGCGRCDDACPEYISFSNCINKLSAELKRISAEKRGEESE